MVAVSVPQPEAKVAAAPLRRRRLRPRPPPPALALRTLATPPPAAASQVAIQSVEADAAGGLIAKGSAGPNATVRFYLNGSNVADAKTQSDGRWSLTIKQGMTPGGYMMRADEVNPGRRIGGCQRRHALRLSGRAGPHGNARPPAASPATGRWPRAAEQRAVAAADVVVDMVQTALVRPGHTLWALSQNYYGDPTRYPVIYEANKWEIHNPEPHLSRRGLRRAEVRAEALTGADRPGAPRRATGIKRPTPSDDRAEAISRLQIKTFDDALGHRIIETHIWAVREGLRGADRLRTVRRLLPAAGHRRHAAVAGHAAMETLHPQWSGYGYTWRRDLNAIQPEQYAHGERHRRDLAGQPVLRPHPQRAEAGEDNPWMRRRLEQGPDQRDFPVLEEFFARGRDGLFRASVRFGEDGDRSHGTGVVYSFTTDRRAASATTT